MCVPSSLTIYRSAADASAITTIDSFAYPAGFTLELWANFDNVVYSDPAQQLAAACSAGHRCMFIELYRDNLSCVIGNGSGFERFHIPLARISARAWHHFSCGYDGTNVRFYLDGQLVAQGPGTYVPPVNGTPLHIAQGAFTGWIDEIHLMNAAVRTGDFAPLDEYTHPNDILRFHMNEGAGTEIVDDVSGIRATWGSSSYQWLPRP